jgi:hypothetical protein
MELPLTINFESIWNLIEKSSKNLCMIPHLVNRKQTVSNTVVSVLMGLSIYFLSNSALPNCLTAS